MPLSNYAIETFVGKDITQLTDCGCCSIKDKYPECEAWLTGFVLTQLLRARLDDPTTKFAFALIRKAEALFTEYDQACSKLRSFIESDKISISLYFKSLHHIEVSISLLYQSFELGRKLIGDKLFEKDDGSSPQRLNNIYNDSRHSDLELIPEDKLHRVWITNESVNSARASVTFQELEAMIREIGNISKKLSNGEFIEMKKKQGNDGD